MSIYKRIWTRGENKVEEPTESYITIYDSGGYIGELFENGSETSWKCWEILNRYKEGETIIESVKEMPEDWVQFNVISKEKYRVQHSKQGLSILSPHSRWVVQTIIQEQPQQQQQKQPLRQQQSQRQPQRQALRQQQSQRQPHGQPQRQNQPHQQPHGQLKAQPQRQPQRQPQQPHGQLKAQPQRQPQKQPQRQPQVPQVPQPQTQNSSPPKSKKSIPAN